MAIEIIPKTKTKPEKELSLPDIFFYLFLVLFVILLLAYAGLEYSWRKGEKHLEELKENIAQKQAAEINVLEKEILEAKKKIDDFSSLVEFYPKTSRFFEFLETVCHKEVFFSDIDVNTEETSAIISGKAENFRILGEQLLILKKEKLIKKAELNRLFIAKEGGVDFEIVLSLDPKVFK